MVADRWLSLALALALLPVARPAAAQESCVRDVRIEQPFAGTVRIEVVDPCRAGRPLTFRHNGQEVVRFADAEGRVTLLRVLDPGRPDVIVLVEDGGERRVFAEVAGAQETATSTAAPAAAPSGERAGEEPAEKAGAAGKAAAAPAATPPAAPQERVTAPASAGPSPAVPTAPIGAAPAPPPRAASGPPAAACPARMEADVRDGLARIRIQAPCPAGTPVTVRVEPRGWTFHRSLGADGAVELAVPLVDPEVRITAEASDGPVAERAVGTATDRWLRVLLVWEAGTDLDLHVLEPGGRLSGSVRHVHPGDPAGGGRALGRLERADDGTRLGTKIESYMVEVAGARGAALRLFVVDAGRGRTPVPPHCSGGELAAPEFRILVAAGREVESRTFRIPPVSCGVRLDDRRFFVPAGRVQVR